MKKSFFKRKLKFSCYKIIFLFTVLIVSFTSLTAVGKCATALEYAHNRSSIASSNVNPFSLAAADASSAIRLDN